MQIDNECGYVQSVRICPVSADMSSQWEDGVVVREGGGDLTTNIPGGDRFANFKLSAFVDVQ